MQTKKQVDVSIRWMIRHDWPTILAIEEYVWAGYGWSEDVLGRMMAQGPIVGMVAEWKEAIVGYMVFELTKKSLVLHNFCVHPHWRRLGVGRQMAEKIKAGIPHVHGETGVNRTKIIVELAETNLDAQLFFRAMGFRAVKVSRGQMIATDEDIFVMEYPGLDKFTKNRLAGKWGRR